MKFKILFIFFLSFGLSAFAEESDGWVTLSEPIRLEAPELFQKGETEGKQEGVVFLKKWGSETFLLHFPEDPSYQTLASGALELKSGPHRVVVTEMHPGGEAVSSGDWDRWLQQEEEKALFLNEGKRISVYATEKSLYQFETEEGDDASKSHLAFLRSFRLSPVL